MTGIRKNPFVLGRYEGPEYFCDREDETQQLIQLLTNGNNVVLTSHRRIGKTDLIQHLFSQPEIKEDYITIYVDIYATKNLGDFIAAFGKGITDALRTHSKALIDKFVEILFSLRAELTFDHQGIPVWGIGIGQKMPTVTLDEIFTYINHAPKPCIIAIDEFQQITNYPDGSQIEALLRSYIQQCNNAQFVYAGSQTHIMAEMFVSYSRPFFQQASLFGLKTIPMDKYAEFCQEMFSRNGKSIDTRVIVEVYKRYDGITAYTHQIMNQIFSLVSEGGVIDSIEIVDLAVKNILDNGESAYTTLLYQIPMPQRNLLFAIAHEGEATAITSGAFVKKHRLNSASSVSSAIKSLVEKDIVVRDKDSYSIYDRFFAQWLSQK